MDYTKAAEDFIRHKMPRGHAQPPYARYQRFNKGECFALFYLMHNEGSSAPGAIAEATHTSTARVTAVLNTLERKGFVLRSMDPCDRRKVIVSLTQAGRDVIMQEQTELTRTLVAVFERMGERDTKEFLRLFGDFFSYMEECFTGGPCGAEHNPFDCDERCFERERRRPDRDDRPRGRPTRR